MCTLSDTIPLTSTSIGDLTLWIVVILSGVSAMKASCTVSCQYYTICIFVLGLIINTCALTTGTSRFILKACATNRPLTTSRFLSTFRSISGNRMRRLSSTVTSQQATLIGGGAYQEVPQKVLLQGVIDKPVELKRPEKLKNKYYGLRHGKHIETLFMLCLKFPFKSY